MHGQTKCLYKQISLALLFLMVWVLFFLSLDHFLVSAA
jgi:hypothetical protein